MVQYASISDPNVPAVLAAVVDPASYAPGIVQTGWIDAANFESIIALVQTGALGVGATVDAKLQRALDASGTAAEDVPGKAITQLTQAAGNSSEQAVIIAPKWAIMGDHAYVSLVITVGGAASMISAAIFGAKPGVDGLLQQPLPASAVQVVGSGLPE